MFIAWMVLDMSVSEGTLNMMMTRYSDREGNVRFDDFVACFIKLKTLQSTCFYFLSDYNGSLQLPWL